MESPIHPSVDQLRQAIRANGGTAACNQCRGEDFSMERVTPMAASGGYGSQRLARTQLTCERCGHVMNFDLEKLRSALSE